MEKHSRHRTLSESLHSVETTSNTKLFLAKKGVGTLEFIVVKGRRILTNFPPSFFMASSTSTGVWRDGKESPSFVLFKRSTSVQCV